MVEGGNPRRQEPNLSARNPGQFGAARQEMWDKIAQSVKFERLNCAESVVMVDGAIAGSKVVTGSGAGSGAQLRITFSPFVSGAKQNARMCAPDPVSNYGLTL